MCLFGKFLQCNCKTVSLLMPSDLISIFYQCISPLNIFAFVKLFLKIALSLPQVELFLLGYVLEVKIIVYKICKFSSDVFQEYCLEGYQRDWHEVSLLTEDDRHYHIPVIKM